MGHQLGDMLLQCSYAGGQCLTENISLVQSSSYGNCYTIQYDKWSAKSSGPSEGLELILFLETEEYVPGITNEKGLQVVIHELDTMPFPDDEGIAVAAGTQTVIGLRQVQVTRLGDPYGPCTDPGDFLSLYNIKYTRTACQKICQLHYIRDSCQCFDETNLPTNTIKNLTDGYGPCLDDTQMKCLIKTKMTFNAEELGCGCNSPCSELQFDKTISSRQWPSVQFANVMIDVICKQNPGPICNNLKDSKSSVTQTEEFIKLNIYFEDLNYEQLSEAADYELTQFLSDVGGTIGLYVGLSVLGIFELFHLLVELFGHCCCGNRSKIQQSTY